MDEKIKTTKRLGLMVRSYRQRLTCARNQLDGALIELENCRRQLGDTRQELQVAEEKLVTLWQKETEIEQLQTERDVYREGLISAKEKLNTLQRLVNGEWVATQDVEEALGITFREGLKRFEFSREASWNPWPLNGQRIETFFRLKEGDR